VSNETAREGPGAERGPGETAHTASRVPRWVEDLPLPTTRTILLAAFGVAMAGVWGLEGALALDLCLLFLCGADYELALRGGSVQGVRHCPDRLAQSMPVEVDLLLRNPGSGARRVQVRDRTPEGWENAPIILAIIPPRSERTLSYRLTPPRRGTHLFGDIWLRVEGPLGLMFRPVRLAASREIHVYPPLRPHRFEGLATYRRVAAHWGLRPSPWRQEGREFESLRDYVEGDDPRKIDWKATARLDRPIVQQHQAERNQIVMILLDAGRLMAAVSEGKSKLDHALEAAVHLAHAALAAGDRVGILAFAEGVRSFVAPRRGRDQLQRMLDVILGLEAALVEPQYEQAVLWLKARVTRRSLVVIFTDLLDEVASEALLGAVGLLRPRHLPLCVTLREAEWSEVMSSPPDLVSGVYERAVLQSLLRQRSKALGSIVQRGGLVLDLTTSELSIGTLRRYLEVKRRGLL